MSLRFLLLIRHTYESVLKIRLFLKILLPVAVGFEFNNFDEM
jgi:hypothetical protein